MESVRGKYKWWAGRFKRRGNEENRRKWMGRRRKRKGKTISMSRIKKDDRRRGEETENRRWTLKKRE